MATVCFKVNIFIYEKAVSKLKLWVGLGKNSNHVLSTVLSEAVSYIHVLSHSISIYYTRIIHEFKSGLNTDL